VSEAGAAVAVDPEGLYVGFDTSGFTGSVAVARGADVLARATLDDRGEHASRLVPAIAEVLEEARIDRGELSGVVVGEGPGSFTGVRVAAATAKGLAHALDRPMWAISSLVATALALEGRGIRYVLFDARGDRVYGACYGIGSIGVETLIPPHGGALRSVLDSEVPPGAVFVGQGADRHRYAIEGAGFAVETGPVIHPSADGLFRYLALHPDTLAVAGVALWEPCYIRKWQPDKEWSA
jgi:tRNA threonylcarbamoyladenosine biosynthesis protein TsaB